MAGMIHVVVSFLILPALVTAPMAGLCLAHAPWMGPIGRAAVAVLRDEATAAVSVEA